MIPFFKKKKQFPSGKDKKEVKEELFVKCEKCGALYYKKQLEQELWVCPECGYHFRITAKKYVEYILDDGKFEERIGENLYANDPLNFPGYAKKLEGYYNKLKLNDAALCGTGYINGIKVVLFVTDFKFLGGSMGSVYGEIFLRGTRKAISEKIPFISLTTSGGGARMHEGIFSLMQMAKTTVGVVELNEANIPYISVVAHPTMGGVMASFASLGDIILAEKGALLGFAGPRVIEQTIRQKLPEGFQTAEFLLEKGFIDEVISRKQLKDRLTFYLKHLGGQNGRSKTN